MTMKCTCSDTKPLAFCQQHSRRFPMLSKLVNLHNCTYPCLQHQYLSKQCSQQLVSFWMASDRYWHQTSSIEFHIIIMHTHLILNRQKKWTWTIFDFFFQRLHWFHKCGIDCLTLTLICPVCSVYMYLLSFVHYSYFQYFGDVVFWLVT